ncbi:MAG: hypothetical protein A3D31_03525 [Candidatus Fluviicola riflensis]|nr:MAG: hypothetical protein CHH17_11505 [Candidatus Fluviicola riflensis]OGS79048.1 MAG: hypothetical protein A3D31_03525 [Candidatus Fluviicola riflensis]OGS86071.1 MAG: hypothetical protein A3E30_11015 [Fluviicola sp. RIFCSPHIGHO2_12_FULL_43_24]OGS86480.1 MAG: hypothetical protein A2724_02985 [Fluviicola sp. RIFCSPHIGHO2_01_FULL_43_53]
MNKSYEEIALEVAENRREALKKELDTIEAYISILRSQQGLKKDYTVTIVDSPSNNEPKIFYGGGQAIDSNYPIGEGLAKKFLYFIDKCQRFVHIREVANMIVETEGKNPYPDISLLSQRISSSTSEEKKSLASIKVGTSTRNIFWGHKDWLNADGSIKRGFEYNESEVV